MYTTWVVFLLLGLAALASPTLAAAATCADVTGGGWVDSSTPLTSCSKALGSEMLTLVFSDEFNKSGQEFSVTDNNAKWTAEDLYYKPTQDLEVYLSRQVTTQDGSAVITLEQGASQAAYQTDTCSIGKQAANFKSGMMSGWNKFCYTGGYVEARVQLPGKVGVPSYWPALWMMGNLGRAGYQCSTRGQWPYSFNTCPTAANMGPNTAVFPWNPPVTPQMFTACGANNLPTGIVPEDWGMSSTVGRGAPEIDIFEASVPSSGVPYVSQTLQMGPVQPPGTSYNPAGLSFPGSSTSFATRLNPWTGLLGRSGNQYQDSISALSNIDASFFSSYHVFGLDWVPGSYVAWYIDGVLVYQVNSAAVGAANNGTWSIPAREIPVEAMYLIFNLGMSKDFSPELDANNLQPLPAEMLVDYVRVYQRSNAINVGCSPTNLPTSTYIACNKNNYVTDSSQNRLITGTCPSGKSGAAAAAALRPAAVLTLVMAVLAALLF